MTQKDIARECGVSQTVVSDVLQGRPRGRVSDETRERILSTARRLAYQPNASARALRSRQSGQIAYVTTQREADRFSALGEQVIGGAARVFTERQLRLVLSVAASPVSVVQALEEMSAAGVCDGVILRMHEDVPALWNQLRRPSVPVVVVGQCSDPLLTSVAHDAPGSIASTVRCLVGRGHRRIGLVGLRPVSYYDRLVREGWHAAMASAGLDAHRWIAEAASRWEAAERVAAWLAEDEAPTAIVSPASNPALGVTHAVARAGKRLGHDFDLAVIAEATLTWVYEPGTWFVGTHHEGIGRRAAEELLRLLEGAPSGGPVRLLPDLIQL